MNVAAKPPVAAFNATVPAWRIRQLRTYLREVSGRAGNADDDGVDLEHRAARRWFERKRTETMPVPRKRRALPEPVLDVMWKAIILGRETGRSTKDIHDDIVSECRKIDQTPPAYTTIHTWRWHLCPEKIVERLGITQPMLPLGETVAVGDRAFTRIQAELGEQLLAPQLTAGLRRRGSGFGLEWRGLAFYEPAIEMWWIARPSMAEDFAYCPALADEKVIWGIDVRETMSPDFWYSTRLSREAYGREHSYPIARDLGEGIIAFRKKFLPYVIPLKPPAPAGADSVFARSLADVVINAYAAARNAPGGPIDLDAVIKWRMSICDRTCEEPQ